jgi:hypothetical protein
MLRAKMKCDSVTKTVNGETIRLHPVHADSEENKTWSKWTPSGGLELTITNPDAFGKLVPGGEYLLDLTPVPSS